MALTRLACSLISLCIACSLPAYAQEPLTKLTPQGQADFARILSPQASGKTLDARSQFTVLKAFNPPSRIQTWNRIAMEATAADHARGPTEGYDQLGPHRASRAIAIVHIAMHDAVNAITKKYKTYSQPSEPKARASIDMAIAVAARDTLNALFPLQRALNRFEIAFREDEPRIPGTDDEKRDGALVGGDAAVKILAAHGNDAAAAMLEPSFGTEAQAQAEPDKYVYISPTAGLYQPDTISNNRTALGYHWGQVTPFVITDKNQFLVGPPPALASAEYAALYNEVKKLGGEPAKGTATTRKAFETVRGTFWAYDGTPGLCAPPRLYNQVAMQIAEQNLSDNFTMNDPSDLARFLALINVAMADTAIVTWKVKWEQKFWRPITAITFSGDDGNAATMRDTGFYPLGAPATNAKGPNFTPPFPAYPSGHAAFGGALFEVLRAFWPDATSFEIISDEYNGQNRAADGGPVRDVMPIQYVRFTDAEWENARSRIWLGIHWQKDADDGVRQGNAVARFVLANAFLPNP